MNEPPLIQFPKNAQPDIGTRTAHNTSANPFDIELRPCPNRLSTPDTSSPSSAKSSQPTR